MSEVTARVGAREQCARWDGGETGSIHEILKWFWQCWNKDDGRTVSYLSFPHFWDSSSISEWRIPFTPRRIECKSSMPGIQAMGEVRWPALETNLRWPSTLSSHVTTGWQAK